MRLLVLDQFSDPGGAQQGLLEFLPFLKERGCHAVVGLPGAGELIQRVRQLGFPVEPIRCGPYTSGMKSLRDASRFAAGTPVLAAQIRHLARESHAHLVYVNGPRILPAAALARLDVPVVFHSHSYLFPGMVRRLTGLALKAAHAWLIGSCRFVSEPWHPFVPPQRRLLVYNGVAGPPEMRPGPPHAPTVACIGRIAPEKGQREFVEAVSLIRRAIPGCRFVVYGAALFAEAGAQRYDTQIRTAGSREGVVFPGWVTDVHAALAATDLLLVPSAGHEATTRVILEAHSAGVPVVAFRSGGIPEVVDEGRDGWLAGSTAEMARLSIEFLSKNPEERAAICHQARESWRQRFTLLRFHEELFAALRQVAGS
jgi:glycosyltransferase involved in cell wall biosynthesis